MKSTRRNELLIAFRNKGACAHTERAAEKIWRELRPLLTDTEARLLQSAAGEWFVGCGRNELDAVVNELLDPVAP
jgi:hypothetical protein